MAEGGHVAGEAGSVRGWDASSQPHHLSEAVRGHFSEGEEMCWAHKVLSVLGSLETKLHTHRCCCTGELGRVAGGNQ